MNLPINFMNPKKNLKKIKVLNFCFLSPRVTQNQKNSIHIDQFMKALLPLFFIKFGKNSTCGIRTHAHLQTILSRPP